MALDHVNYGTLFYKLWHFRFFNTNAVKFMRNIFTFIWWFQNFFVTLHRENSRDMGEPTSSGQT